MRIFAIDPGPVQSAFVLYDGRNQRILDKGIEPNEAILNRVATEEMCGSELVIEQVASFGMAVGAEVFETVFWSGRFAQAFGREFHRLKRHEVKMHLCHSMRAKDGNIIQALIDKIGPKGTKKSPGPTYGFAGDLWQALAVAVVFAEKRGEQIVKELFHAEQTAA